MNKAVWWVILAVILGIMVGGYYALRPHPPAAPPPAPEPAAAPAPAPPPIEHPIEQAQPGAAAPAPLPALDESDHAFADALAALIGPARLHEFLIPQSLIRHIVATVDNLPRAKVSQRVMPVKPVPGRFLVSGQGEALAIDPNNVARYAPYMKLLQAVDVRKCVALYVRFYPLFQQAYRELGYPTGYFNDRLIAAIDDMLLAPQPASPVRLTQPNVLYEYADADLQVRSAGQKIVIRIGAANAAIVKAKLREIRHELTRKVTQP